MLGVAAVGAGVDGCATAPNNEYDSGYYPTPTSTTRAPMPEASPGDEEPTTQPMQGDETTSPPTDDATEPPDGGDDADDGGEEAAAAPCTSGQTCVDVPPMGWTGYVQLRIADADAGTGSCTAPYAAPQLSGVADPSGAPAQCSACSCGAPTSPVTCASGFATLNILCTSADTYTALPNGTCVSATFANGGTEAPTATSAPTCATQGGQMIGGLDAATSTPAIICSGVEAGAAATADAGTGPTCSSTQACATSFASQAGPSGVCIYQSGVQTCPTGIVFTEQHLVGSSILDTRGCGCSCGAAQCPSDGVVEGYSTTGCTGTSTVALTPGSKCDVGFSAPSHFKFVQSRSDAGGSCEVDDGGPAGGVSVDTATTLCCIP